MSNACLYQPCPQPALYEDVHGNGVCAEHVQQAVPGPASDGDVVVANVDHAAGTLSMSHLPSDTPPHKPGCNYNLTAPGDCPRCRAFNVWLYDWCNNEPAAVLVPAKDTSGTCADCSADVQHLVTFVSPSGSETKRCTACSQKLLGDLVVEQPE